MDKIEKLENKKTSRNFTIDFVRIFAILLVVANHCLDSLYGNFALGKTSTYIYCFLYDICRLGVPLFLMISGFLLLSKRYDEKACKKFYLKNLLPLVICWAVWVVIYNIFFVASGQAFVGILGLLEEMLMIKWVGISHEWYMYVIVLLYIFIPFIANALNSMPVKYTVVCVIFIFVYYFVFPNSNLTVDSGVAYFLYIMLGFLAYKYNEKRNENLKKRNAFLFICTAVVMLALTVTYQIIIYNCEQKIIFLWYTSPVLSVVGFLVFMFFLDSIKMKEKKWIANISSYCFGVYLIHNLIVISFPKIFQIESAMLFVICEFLFVTVISFLIVFLISFVPYLRKILFRLK